MITSRHQNVIQNQNIVIGNLSFENVEKFRYLGVTVTNTNDIREEIKHRIDMGNACYYSIDKILSSRLISKKLKVKTYKTIILPIVLYGCETWSFTLREEHRYSRIKYLGRYFGLRETNLQENEERYIIMSYTHCILRLTLLGILNQDVLRWAGLVAHMEQSRNVYRVLVGKPEGKRP